MLKNYGTEQRTLPRLRVLRGWDPNNPSTRTAKAPIADGVTIKSGQVISLQWGGGGYEEWNLGVVATSDIPHFAVQDSDDFDVVGSGLLTGLSSLDNIELQTPYFHASPSPAYGNHGMLKADGVTGSVTSASAGDTILGFQSRFNAPNDIVAEDSSSVPDVSTGKVLVLTLQTAFQRAVV